MKTIHHLTIVFIGATFMLACESNQELRPEDSGPWEQQFNANMVTSLTPTSETGDCVAPHNFFNNQEGEGKSNILGSFTTKITFCVDLATLQYVGGEGTFFAENGDELYFTISGQIMPSDHPNYQLEFQDPFVFTGGTGRYAGASGSGVTDSLVKLFPEGGDQTDHKLRGTLILPQKPKKN